MKEILRKIVFHGNDTEQEYAFKVLNQLCFDKCIAADILNDKDLLKLMNEIIINKTNQNNLVKTVNGILWLINKKEEKEIKSDNIGKHIFISYNSESRSICLNIKTFLESIGFKCWIDVENIHGSSIDAMAKGIETASCVLICMTEKYKESNNCRMEAEYTLQKQKPFVPLILQKSFHPDGWLGFMLGSKIYIDYTKYSFEECSSRLQKELKNYHDHDTALSTVSNNSAAVKKETENKSVVSSGQIISNKWSEEEVVNYFKSKKVNDLIIENLMPIDGRLLEQLYRTLKEVPEFFHSILRADTKASLRDIVFFTTELRQLFNGI
jgi:transcriptional regulator NrdR family protein